MILGSIIGSLGFIGSILTFLISIVGSEFAEMISLTLTILGYLAAGGGLTVIVGALIAGYGPDKLGRIIIGFGVGISLIGLLIILVTNIISGVSISDLVTILLGTFNGVYGLCGVVIVILSRMRLKD